jgi:butyrate kinase
MPRDVLVINPGSTSTKVAVYEDGEVQYSANIPMPAAEADTFGSVFEQLPFREAQLRASFARWPFDLRRLGLVMARGGFVRPLSSGIYRVDPEMLADLAAARFGEHASNLGAHLAATLAAELGIEAYIVDPVVVDELSDVARVTGHALFRRRSIFHALNQKAVAKRWCRENGRVYDHVSLIVAHMGGGVTVGLHRNGRVVDVNNGLDGDGPFSAERAGTLPEGDLVRLCFSGKRSEREVLSMITGKGGLQSLMGTNDFQLVEERARAGDEGADLALRAFALGVAKAIGALAAEASGRVDQILLTGGIAYSSAMMTNVSKMCKFIAPSTVYPGENELDSLAGAGFRLLSGEEKARDYRVDAQGQGEASH